jgi:ATP-dependent helicase/nuclease subunit B
MDGIALADASVIQAMDTGETSVSIPPAINQSGAMRKNAKALDAKHLDALMIHSKAKAARFSERMLAGDITIMPVKHGARESCTYCDYRSICGYDPLARGAQETEIFSMSLEELAEHLDQETEE